MHPKIYAGGCHIHLKIIAIAISQYSLLCYQFLIEKRMSLLPGKLFYYTMLI